MRRAPLRSLARGVSLAVVLLALACSRPSPETELEVGRHRLSLRVPRGWLYVDQGFEKRFRQEATFVDVTDLGPVAGSRYAEELARAHEYWQASGTRVGYEETSKLLAPRELFASPEDFELQAEYRRKLVKGYEEGDGPLADANYQALLELLAGLTPLEPDAVTALALERVKFQKSEREVVSTEDVVVDGRPARLVRTWARLTHQGPQRYAFIVNAGSLLGVETSGDRHDASSAAFDAIVGSLRFVSAP